MITFIVLLSLYILWLCFVLAMSFKRHWKVMGPIAKAFAVPPIIGGFVLDVVVNIASTALFLDLPREWTLSNRLKRYNHNALEPRWRRVIAYWVCTNLLDQFDPDGDHC